MLSELSAANANHVEELLEAIDDCQKLLTEAEKALKLSLKRVKDIA